MGAIFDIESVRASGNEKYNNATINDIPIVKTLLRHVKRASMVLYRAYCRTNSIGDHRMVATKMEEILGFDLTFLSQSPILMGF